VYARAKNALTKNRPTTAIFYVKVHTLSMNNDTTDSLRNLNKKKNNNNNNKP